MSSKKPWRTVVTGDSTGRFTREQIRDAVDSVASRSKSGSAESKSGTHSRGRASESGATQRVSNEKGRTGLGYACGQGWFYRDGKDPCRWEGQDREPQIGQGCARGRQHSREESGCWEGSQQPQRRLMVAGYDRSVFINCPFDDRYRPLLHAIIFAVQDCGFLARCALEVEDSGEERIRKIKRIIRECQYGCMTSRVSSSTRAPAFRASTCRWSWACS
jgi:hypothetical protein